jgi:hypothetical protein
MNRQPIIYVSIIGFTLMLLEGCMYTTGQDESDKTDILIRS